MKIRRFRAYGEKDDLRAVFEEFQTRLEIRYVPAYSDSGEIFYNSIMDIENLGVNFHGSHIGNMQMLIFRKDAEYRWRPVPYSRGTGQEAGRLCALSEENSGFICADLNGVYCENAIFPTEISTMYYDGETAKKMYDELQKIFRRQAVKAVNGAWICPGL